MISASGYWIMTTRSTTESEYDKNHHAYERNQSITSSQSFASDHSLFR